MGAASQGLRVALPSWSSRNFKSMIHEMEGRGRVEQLLSLLHRAAGAPAGGDEGVNG